MRRLLPGWILLSLSLSAALAADYQKPQTDRLLDEPVLRRARLATLWQATLPNVAGARIEYIHRLGDELYCLFTDHTVQVLDVRAGTLRWGGPIGRPDQRVWRPVHWGEQALFASFYFYYYKMIKL